MIWIKLLIVIFVICFHLSSVDSIHCTFCRGTVDCLVNPPKTPKECRIRPEYQNRKCILILPENRQLKDFRRDCLVSNGKLYNGCKFYKKEEVKNLDTPSTLCTCGTKGCNGQIYDKDGSNWPVKDKPIPIPGPPEGGGSPSGPDGDLIEDKDNTELGDDDDDDGGAFIGPQPQPITILILTSILICLFAKIMDN